MTAHLVKLQPAPDLVDRVYRALLDAISDGSLAPGARLTQEDIAARLAVSRQPVLQALRLLEEGRPRASTRPAAASSSRRSTPPGSPRSTRCAARSTRWPRGWPPGAAPSLDPEAGRDRPARRARPRHPGDGRSRHRLPRRDLRRLGQPADRPERAPALGAPAPRHGRGAAAVAPARGALGRARRDRRRDRRAATPTRAADLIDHHGRRASDNLLARLADVLDPPTRKGQP